RRQEAPRFRPHALLYRIGDAGVKEAGVRVAGTDDRYFLRDGRAGYALIDQYTGELGATTYLPGRQTATAATLSSFFALHFGNFGGLPVRILYVVLGMLGALVFYSGNLLWIEARLKKRRPGQPPAVQPRHVRWLAALTVGASLGCAAALPLGSGPAAVAGRPAGPAGGRRRAVAAGGPAMAARYAYCAGFCLRLVLAFRPGAARASAGRLWGAAALGPLVPASNALWFSF